MSGYTPRHPSGVRLRFKHERFLELAAAKGWTTQTQQAEGTGISQPTICRILNAPEEWTPSPEAIAGMLAAFEVAFEELFEVIPVGRRLRRAS